MKKGLIQYKILPFLLSLAILVVPMVLFAAGSGGGGTGVTAKISNPLKKDTIQELILAITDAVVEIGYYIVVFFILYSGFLFVKARGDEKGLGDAKKTFLWTVVGAAVLLGAQVLSLVIKNTVAQL